MPTMANITVKDSANVDVVYTAATPSAGDRSPARWTANAVSAIAGFRPSVTLATRDNGSNRARVFEANFARPHIQTVAGVDSVKNKTTFKMTGTLPTDVAASDVLDAYVQFGNLLVSTLFRDSASTGYAPT